MTTTNHARIKVDNNEVIKVVAEELRGATISRNSGGVMIHATGRNDEVHNKLKEVSKGYPGVTIRAKHTLSINRHEKVYSVEYKNGLSKTVKEEYNYIFQGFNAPPGYTTNQIRDIVLGEFERVDNLSKAANKDRRLKKVKGGLYDNDGVLIDMVRIDLKDIVIQATVESNLVKVRIWKKEVVLKELT